MKGSFSIGLLEVLAYLAPGLVVMYAAYVIHQQSLLPTNWPKDWDVLYLLVGAYIAGHIVTIVSRPASWLRGALKILAGSKSREERYTFYSEFERALESYLGYVPLREDHYPFALRISAEYCSESNKTIDRLFALTLFSRNMSVALALLSLGVWPLTARYGGICLLAAAAFFYRYIEFERNLEGTVFRSSFMYLVRTRQLDP